jgi:hypothetical protein
MFPHPRDYFSGRGHEHWHSVRQLLRIGDASVEVVSTLKINSLSKN